MFQIGNKVIYGAHGVCDIVEQEQRVVDRKTVTYLVLEPAGQGNARYLVPTHNAAAMGKLRHLLSREELESILQSEEVRADGWIREENQRKQMYRELISSADCGRLLCMVRTLYAHKASQAALGRKCHISDESFLRDAERILASEVSVILGLDLEQAKNYIKENLKPE